MLKRKPKCLGISGSPREGNTFLLVKKALSLCESGGMDTEFISLKDVKIDYCDGCDACGKYPYKCPKKDDVEKIISR